MSLLTLVCLWFVAVPGQETSSFRTPHASHRAFVALKDLQSGLGQTCVVLMLCWLQLRQSRLCEVGVAVLPELPRDSPPVALGIISLIGMFFLALQHSACLGAGTPASFGAMEAPSLKPWQLGP